MAEHVGADGEQLQVLRCEPLQWSMLEDLQQFLPAGHEFSAFKPLLTRVDAKTTQITTKRAGKVTVNQTIVVSDDGKTRTTTTKGTNAKGEAVDGVSFYEKQ